MKQVYLVIHTKCHTPLAAFLSEADAIESVRSTYYGVEDDINFTTVDTPSPREVVSMIEVRYKYALIATIRTVNLHEQEITL